MLEMDQLNAEAEVEDVEIFTQHHETSTANNDSSSGVSTPVKKRSRSASDPETGDARSNGNSDGHSHGKDQNWKGWAELENDPLIFTKLLKDWGVSNIKVDEVIPLDTILEKPSDSVVGLIFLSRWTAPDEHETSTEPPDHLWFANQVSTFSCATLALMNIVTNVQDIDLGPQIEDFKESTALMSSAKRGQALDQFAFVRNIHNSFSRELDHLIVDLKLKEDYQAAVRKQTSNKKKKKRRKRTSELVDDGDDNGFHFVAYVASRGEVWKLDGMEALPRLLGSYKGGENWLMSTVADIQQQLDGPEANAMEFSLLSLTRHFGTVIEHEDEMRVERMKEDWSPFLAHMLKFHAEKGDLETLVSW